MPDDTLIAALLFVGAYVLIAVERWDRTLIALLTAMVMVLLGIVDQHEAFAAIDLNVIFLLVGMMIIASILARTGFFEWLAIRSVRPVGWPPDPAAADPLARHRGRLGPPGQRHHGGPDDARDALGRATPGDLAGPVPDRADPRVQHRRHGDPDRGPAQHPHRLGRGPRVRRVPVEPGAGGDPDLHRLRRDHGPDLPQRPQGAGRATPGGGRGHEGPRDHRQRRCSSRPWS